MKRSTDRILTSHAGSLPRPPALLEMNRAKQRGEPIDQSAWEAEVRAGVAAVVRKQVEAGIDIVNDGEYSKGNFLNYGDERLTGFERLPVSSGPTTFTRRDFQKFADFYRETYPNLGAGGRAVQPMCTGPIRYKGQAAVQFDIDNLKAALAGVDMAEAFLPAIAPGTFGRGQNRYYATEEEFLFAIAAALKEEYRAIVDAGFVLQIDDPGLPDTWDLLDPEPSVEAYKTYAMVRIEALNSALAGLPEDRIRYHICWGSWSGAHTTDLPLEHIVDLLLQVRAQTYSVEAANVRHEHEWKVWRDVKLPDGKILMPGVVTHKTNVVEHPELVADRIVQYANLVGRENVIAGTDCGVGGRVHPQIAWAKLQVLREGADRATQQLWG
jgi:5-methyltetrahydropteroyltriglutamate--homocysteine methyltransferase